MPKPCQFSEFSYGYAVTEECIRKYVRRIYEAPRFPTLRAERAFGYDVRVAGFMFLQFKRPSVVTGHRAREKEENPPNLSGDVYRMPVYSNDSPSQHDRLMALERRVGRRGCVLYVSPCFHTRVEFNHYYLNRSLLENSLLVRPEAIGSLSPERHRLSYNRACFSTHAWRYSKPEEIEAMSVDDLSRDIEKLSNTSDFSATEVGEFIRDLLQLISDDGIMLNFQTFAGVSNPRLYPMAHLANIVRRGFGAEMLVIGTRKRRPPLNL